MTLNRLSCLFTSHTFMSTLVLLNRLPAVLSMVLLFLFLPAPLSCSSPCCIFGRVYSFISTYSRQSQGLFNTRAFLSFHYQRCLPIFAAFLSGTLCGYTQSCPCCSAVNVRLKNAFTDFRFQDLKGNCSSVLILPQQMQYLPLYTFRSCMSNMF